MPSITDRLDQIAARADAATVGPWDAEVEIDGIYADRRTVVKTRADLPPMSARRIVSVGQTRRHRGTESDVAFIAAARQDVPDLVAALRAVLTLRDEWVEQADAHENGGHSPVSGYGQGECDTEARVYREVESRLLRAVESALVQP